MHANMQGKNIPEYSSSLKCAHAFQCKRLQDNHTSLKLSDPLQHFTKQNMILAI